MQTMHKGLPWGLNLWGFTDFNGTQGTRDDHFELTQFFTEYRLRKPLPKLYKVEGLGVELEYNEASGADNGLLRVGLTFKHAVSTPYGTGWLQWRGLPYETDGSGQQLSMIHFFALGERLTLAGFSDFNLNKHGPNRWVAESQLACLIHGQLWLTLEARYNGFQSANPSLDGSGIALGLSIRP
jgi:hypothetical protein